MRFLALVLSVAVGSMGKSFSTFSLNVIEPVSVSVLLAESTPGQKLLGNNQPFAPTVQLDVEFFGKRFELDFTHEPHITIDNNIVEIHAVDELTGEDAVTIEPFISASYSTQIGQHGWAALTLREDGLYHLVLNDEEDVYHVDPVDMHSNLLGDDFSLFTAASSTGLAAYRLSDRTESGLGQCGTDASMVRPTAPDATHDQAHESHDHNHENEAARFRVMGDFDIPRLANMPTVTQEMTVGWGVNVGFYRMCQTTAACVAFVANSVNVINRVWLKQLNTYLRLGMSSNQS